jgi:hypothetical protein
MRLRDLDDRYLPDLARRLDALVSRLPSPPEPSGPAPLVVRLRRVDDRWTRRGPLALLRDVPQLGAVAIAAVLLVNGVTLGQRLNPPPKAAPPAAVRTGSPEPGDPDDGHLGPEIGDKVPLYLATAKNNLVQEANGSPDGQAVAVVSLTTYRTPEQVRDLVRGTEVLRVFFRAPLRLPAGAVHSVVVGDLVTDTRKAIARAGAERAAQAAELLKVAKTIENDPAQKADQEKDAKIYQRESELLRGGCACVYAVAVRARLRVLADLLNQPTVRVVDAGARDVGPGDYEYSALLPEEKVVVTAGNQA